MNSNKDSATKFEDGKNENIDKDDHMLIESILNRNFEWWIRQFIDGQEKRLNQHISHFDFMFFKELETENEQRTISRLGTDSCSERQSVSSIWTTSN